jgi:hypothetical protein
VLRLLPRREAAVEVLRLLSRCDAAVEAAVEALMLLWRCQGAVKV